MAAIFAVMPTLTPAHIFKHMRAFEAGFQFLEAI